MEGVKVRGKQGQLQLDIDVRDEVRNNYNGVQQEQVCSLAKEGSRV